MNLNANKNRLVGITRELSLQWDETKNFWHDEKCLEFEHRYIEGLFQSVDRAVMVVEKLDEILKKIRSDCE